MKKILKRIGLFTEELTAFVPDVVLAIAILCVIYGSFGQYDFMIKILLFVVYFALTYAERIYFSMRFVNKNINKVINSKYDELVEMINKKKYVSTEKLLTVLELQDGAYNESLLLLEERINNKLTKKV